MHIIKAGAYKFNDFLLISNSNYIVFDFVDLSLTHNYGIRLTYNEQYGIGEMYFYRTSSLSQTIIVYSSGLDEPWYGGGNYKIIFIPNNISVDDNTYAWFNNNLTPYTENIATKTNTISYRGDRVTIINGDIVHNGVKYNTATLPTKDKKLTQDITITTTITN